MSITDKMIHCTKRALNIQKSLGTKVAAGYLRNQGYSVEFAIWKLCGV